MKTEDMTEDMKKAMMLLALAAKSLIILRDREEDQHTKVIIDGLGIGIESLGRAVMEGLAIPYIAASGKLLMEMEQEAGLVTPERQAKVEEIIKLANDVLKKRFEEEWPAEIGEI